MRVRIYAQGREVEIDGPDTNVTYDALTARAYAMWQATGGGPADALGFGLVSAERSERTLAPGPAGGYLHEVQAHRDGSAA